MNDETCAVDNCDKPVQARGWCGMHYARWNRHGDPEKRTRRLLLGVACSIDGCEEPARTRGWCDAHYERWRKHGDPEYTRRRSICSIEDCETEVYAKSLCPKHYSRLLRHGDPTYLQRPKGRICDVDGCEEPHSSKGKCARHAAQAWRASKRQPRKPAVRTLKCTVDGCERFQVARGWCSTHYARFRAHGTFETRPQVDGTVDGNGYRKLYRPGHRQAYDTGYVAEHRMVMSDLLGRRLLSSESPHHKNLDRLDNRPENLELWVSSQPRGARAVDLLEWAREIIDRYGDVDPAVLS